MSSETQAMLRAYYDAYAARDIPTLDGLMADDCVAHVAGHHPLSGTYRGKAAIWEYIGKVAAISGGNGGFEVHSITTDDNGHGVALLTGTIRDYVRPVIHIMHVRNGQSTEFWDAYLDAEAEDAWWSNAMADTVTQP